MTYLYIMIGGALGAFARHANSTLWKYFLGGNFPYWTLTANILGSFIMGILVGYFARNAISEEWRAFLTVGFCGGFTTFSAFALESVLLAERGEYWQSGLYILASVVLSIAALLAGLALTRYIAV